MITKELIERNSVLYSEKFGLNLKKDPFPWFLLSVLFGARISESIALKTFYLFKRENIISPEEIIKAGFDGLVSILDSGGYTRYDFRTAAKLEEMSRNIVECGGLNQIHEDSENMEGLVAKLKSLAKGIGDVTVGIFMREMIEIWKKARPYPSPMVMKASDYLGIDPVGISEGLGVSYASVESFLVKVARECIRKKKEKNEFCESLK